MKLMRLAEEGSAVDALTLLFNREVAIERGGREVDRSRDGALIGEISFIQGGAATATVRVARPSRLVVWPKAKGQGLLRRNPTLDVAMQGVFSKDLTRKLVRKGGGTPLPILDAVDRRAARRAGGPGGRRLKGF
jgi:CRP-like cAMP-binding protein